MTDLIERYRITANLPSVMKNYCNRFNSKQIESITAMIYELENSIESCSDVQLIRRGRWIGIYEYCEKNGYVPSGMGIYYWCSECDKAEQKTSDFCPNCGADMR